MAKTAKFHDYVEFSGKFLELLVLPFFTLKILEFFRLNMQWVGPEIKQGDQRKRRCEEDERPEVREIHES
ncbi:hypothetical protein Syun_031073 [Stephania yunnanensis]|uniref:Uncharacterized protein n=1 Tax=Stephania yunnanensis TaxID=152371 RepID=A0AAP0DW38_9MAGN